MKKLLIGLLISAWMALGITAALPHAHAGEKPASGAHIACMICQAQSVHPSAEAAPTFSAPVSAPVPLILEKMNSPIVEFTAFSFSSRAPPILSPALS
jgi:hypothetical protein